MRKAFIITFLSLVFCFNAIFSLKAQLEDDYLKEYATIPENTKKIIVWKYSIHDGDTSITSNAIDLSKEEREEEDKNRIIKRDEQGRITLITDRFDGLSIRSYEYPEENVEISYSESFGEFNYHKTIKKYNSKNQLIRLELKDSTEGYTYNIGDKMIEHAVTTFSYDSKGLLDKQQTFILPGYTTKQEVDYLYDDKKREVRRDEKNYYGNDKVKGEIEKQIITTHNYYNFGEERLFIKNTTEIGKYSTNSQSWKYTYQDNKMILQIEQRGFINNDYVYEFTYQDESYQKLLKVKAIKNTSYNHYEGDWIEYEYIF